MAVALVLGLLAAAPGTLGTTTRQMMVDAFFGVSAFVAGALLLLYGLERLFAFDMAETMRRARGRQVPLAALLGVMPGCGGAVVVVAAHAAGNVGFGALVAALVATMGDAAFLLLARRPDTAAVLLPLAFLVGTLSGWIVDALGITAPARTRHASSARPQRLGRTRGRDVAFVAVVLPGLALGTLALAGGDPAEGLGADAVAAIGLLGTAVCLVVWAFSPLRAMAHEDDSPITRAAEETSFVGVWVVGAFLAYEYAVVFGGLDLAPLFAAVAPALPLIAIAIGFLPGCGPQILVTTLYVNGVLPFAALLGNALANDGDALFPAIALEPKAALKATIVSAVPALVVAYAVHLLAPELLR
ncbi:MAG: putative manganese transporter [Myxococcota bacterium]